MKGWECATCGRDNRPGTTHCLLCGQPVPQPPGGHAAGSGLHGLARWKAGLAAIEARHGELLSDPTPYGGRETLELESDGEIDKRLAEAEADHLQALREGLEEAA